MKQPGGRPVTRGARNWRHACGDRGSLPRRAPWLGCVLLLPLVLTSCEMPTADAPHPRMVVAVTATSAEPAPALTAAQIDRLSELASQSEVIHGAEVVTLVGAGRQGVLRKPKRDDLTPMRQDDQVERTDDKRKELVTEAVDDFSAQLGAETSEVQGLDLLELLDRAAAQDVDDIVVISSGVSTADPLDFRQLGWNQSVKSVVDGLAKKHLLPRHLGGKNVTFVGLGVTAGPQPRLASPEQTWVERLWLSVCRQAGADECRVDPEIPPASEPAATQPVPVVPVPTYDTDTGGEWRPDGECRTVVRLPGKLLFDGDSAAIRPSADAVLRDVVAEVRSGARITEVAGHTADAGAGDGQVLSQQRAASVADRLVALGMDRSRIDRVVGYGDSRPVKRNFSPDGSFNEALAARNRRVEITTARTQCDTSEKDGKTND